MPELPDVEGFRAVIARHAVGHQIDRVDVADAGVLRGVTAAQLDEALRGCRFTEPQRHGKWLIACTDGPAVLMHFGMTGSLVWRGSGAPGLRYDRVVFRTDVGALHYSDMRKLQGIRLACDRAGVDRVLAGLGPDARGVRREELGRLLSGRRGAIKATLIDQQVIAGLGNLLADEILWRAHIHPLRAAGSLTPIERDRLDREMHRVLRESIRAGQVPPKASWLTGARAKQEARCPRCGTRLCRGRVGGRTTVWCPDCQVHPRVSARPGLPIGGLRR